MSFKPWSEIEGREKNDSPYSPTGPVRGFPNTEEAGKLLDEANDPSQRLDPKAADEAREKYLKSLKRDLGAFGQASTPSKMGFGKPGEAGTDGEASEDTDENVEGYQIVRPADPEEVDRRQAAQGEEETSDPLETQAEKDHWVVEDPNPTETKFPAYTNDEVTRLPKEGNSVIDGGPKYGSKPQPDNISMTRDQVMEAAKGPKSWHDVQDKSVFNEPNYPDDFAREQKRKKDRSR